MAWKVAVTAGVGAPGLEEELLSAVGANVRRVSCWTESDLIAAAHDADATLAGPNEPYTRRVIEALARCRIISRFGIGYDNIDIAAATRHGICVAIVPDASIEEVSDHALALILACARRIVALDHAVKSGLWQGVVSPQLMAIRRAIHPLRGQLLGIVGIGRIGAALARKAAALGLSVLSYDPYVSDEAARLAGTEPVSFKHLLEQSDFVSLHLPLTKENAGLFGLEQFRLMKPGAFLINTSRGELIDEEALLTALGEGAIAGAALDVISSEPPDPEDPLLKQPKVIVTAHSAWYSDESVVLIRRRAVEAVVQTLKGEWPRYMANPEVREMAATQKEEKR